MLFIQLPHVGGLSRLPTVNALSSILPSRSFQLDVSARGYQVLFRSDETNRCPGCGHSQWMIGRITAECSFCGTALPLAEAEWSGMGPNAGHTTAHRAVSLHVVDAASDNPANKRREERVEEHGRVLGLYINGAPQPFAVRNSSPGGMMGEALPDIAGAQTLFVELEDGTRLPAVLKWTDGDFVGLAFVTDEPKA
jgi:hypothetical protein